jgi:hypothetical protein
MRGLIRHSSKLPCLMSVVATCGCCLSTGRADVWTATATKGAPSARQLHVAVWTGSKMIVWSGEGSRGASNTGGIYDPIANSWVSTSTQNAPQAREEATAVWTGTHMIAWGGQYGSAVLNSGGIFDPAAGTNGSWIMATSITGAPAARRNHTAIWTGSEMIVWGGIDPFVVWPGDTGDTGGRYDPRTDTWRATSVSGLAPRYEHTAVWTGSHMILWGGRGTQNLNDGAVYDPASDTWTSMTTVGAPKPRSDHTAVFTGTKMVVFGGFDDNGNLLNDGGQYDPATDSWEPISTANAPSARHLHTAVWTGTHMIVWGGFDGTSSIATGGSYDPVMDTWVATSLAGCPSPRDKHTSVFTGTRMIVWGGLDSSVFISPMKWTVFNTGGVYTP